MLYIIIIFIINIIISILNSNNPYSAYVLLLVTAFAVNKIKFNSFKIDLNFKFKSIIIAFFMAFSIVILRIV